MALTNHDRVGKALGLLKEGLAPFVLRELVNAYGDKADAQARRFLGDDRTFAKQPIGDWDANALLRLMWEAWHDVFRNTLGHAERSLVSELREHRHRWAHQQTFSSDDADRALDSMARLLTAVSAPQADEIGKMKFELRRLIFEEQARSEKRRSVGTAIESHVTGTLKAWREVVNPHKDVASGLYQQAEFAADLWQVHMGEGSAEYLDPAEFFRRTFLTESLRQLLTGAVRRLGGKDGNPVVQLQTNFGGGKTHSMLALYHLFSGAKPSELLGVDEVLAAAGMDKLPAVRRVVLVGNRISPGNPSVKADGTVVRTLWGELAWQLGGKKAYQRIQADDEKATSPGDVLRELMNEYGPCLILVDEWVAYARQLHDGSDLPAGTFETHFTFAQALTESAKAAKHCLLVISLPASDSGTSPSTLANDVEVGGQRGREALDRLRNVVGRLESSWRPASAEEGFEIVRRRLFEPLIDREQWTARDNVARAFSDLYRTQAAEFPPECSRPDYEKRLKAAYPIHPEVFDRLYTDWSTLLKFQRTRGVLRLMAAVIHSLWEKGDRNPLIMPANLAIDDPRVQQELTRYLSDNWVPVIEKDVDGPSALPQRFDADRPNLGKYAACRRVARTIYLGSAPTATAANRGLEDRQVRLGCVMPGEPTAVFGDALRSLANAATYLYQDGTRYWFSTQPTVTKLAEDRAEQLKRNPDAVAAELDKRIRLDLQRKGDFGRVHPFPAGSADVPDELDARLVALRTDHPYVKGGNSPAETVAKALNESRGNAPRLYRNALVFLAVDQQRLNDLDEAVRRYLAWESIVAERDTLNLDPHQARQAETQKRSADGVVTSRLPEAFQWLIVPDQRSPQGPVEWRAIKLTGTEPLAVRAGKKLRGDELLFPSMSGTRLRHELDRVLWRGDHVPIRQLVEDCARYVYLPRLTSPAVLVQAVRDGLGLLLWNQESFAYADSFDEATGRYRGLRAGPNLSISVDHLDGLLVKPDVAMRQMKADQEEAARRDGTGHGERSGGEGRETGGGPGDQGGGKPAPATVLRRFHGAVELDPTRVGRDAGRIAEEVIAHLAGLPGVEVRVTLEVEAKVQGGVPDGVVRTVSENSRTLKFTSQGFEVD